jgi:diadenylate cyclase
LSAELSKSVGTRHRAGIGLSEETDAVVIIISEETGSIATAVDGRLERNVDMGSLREFLTDMFAPSKERERS